MTRKTKSAARKGRRGTAKKSQYHQQRIKYLKSRPGSDYNTKKLAYHQKRLKQAKARKD